MDCDANAEMVENGVENGENGVGSITPRTQPNQCRINTMF
jgi:hypothetical protein